MTKSVKINPFTKTIEYAEIDGERLHILFVNRGKIGYGKDSLYENPLGRDEPSFDIRLGGEHVTGEGVCYLLGLGGKDTTMDLRVLSSCLEWKES